MRFLPDTFAQRQTALYEQFLASLQAFTLSLDASGMRVTPDVLRGAEEEFESSSENLLSWFFSGVGEFADSHDLDCSKIPEEVYERYLGYAERSFHDAFYRCIAANKSTFISAIRFGGSFGGLSDLLGKMHGSMGYLVQRKAREMKWNARTRDGKTISCLKLIYVTSRHFAYRFALLDTIWKCSVEGKNVAIVNENGDEIEVISPDELLKSDELCDKWFHHNSRNLVRVADDAF
jgi:hypothetical protein